MRRMNIKPFLPSFGLIVGLALVASNVAMAGVSHSLNVGGRYHQKHSVFTGLPYDDGDISGSVAYEYRDADALWQVACDLTPEFESRDDLDYGITPQLNLLLVDRMVQGGLGILSTYTHGDAGGDWMDMYWQLILGLALPFPGPFKVQVNAYYVFEEWGDIGEFDVGDIEYGAYIGYTF
jgi:hypothetical protein